MTFECWRLPISVEYVHTTIRIANDNLIVSVCRACNGRLLQKSKAIELALMLFFRTHHRNFALSLLSHNRHTFNTSANLPWSMLLFKSKKLNFRHCIATTKREKNALNNLFVSRRSADCDGMNLLRILPLYYVIWLSINSILWITIEKSHIIRWTVTCVFEQRTMELVTESQMINNDNKQ